MLQNILCNFNYFNKRIIIKELKEELSETENKMIMIWSKKMLIWADIQPIDALTNIDFDKINTKLTHIIITRYTDKITINDKIEYNNRFFYIKNIVNYREQNKYLNIYCEEYI